jgi:hypothetical protein
MVEASRLKFCTRIINAHIRYARTGKSSITSKSTTRNCFTFKADKLSMPVMLHVDVFTQKNSKVTALLTFRNRASYI